MRFQCIRLRLPMLREIRANNINELSNTDKYYLEKTIEAASKRYANSDFHEVSREVLEGRDYGHPRVGTARARKRHHKRYVFAATAVEGRRKRAVTGFNSYTKTHPKQKWYSIRNGESPDRCYTHAELHALSRAHRVDTLYIARVDSRGNTGLARPCSGCREAIIDYGVRRIVYT